MLTITLAYSTDDQAAAHRIVEDLSSHVEFNHVPVGKANEGPLLMNLLRDVTSPVVLLVSDSLLTNPNCILNTHELLEGDTKLLPVYVEGRRYDELTDEVIETTTSLNNQADVLHYVNHWQDRYIDLRTQADELAREGGESFQNYLRKIREASKQVEELLFLLKDRFSQTEEQLARNHYHQLFIFADRPQLWEEYRTFADAPVDLSGIPGLEMLAPAGQTGGGAQVQSELEEAGEFELEPDDIVDDMAASIVPIDTANAEVVPIGGEDNEHPVVTPSENLSPDEQAVTWVTRAWQLFDGGDADAGLELLSAGQDALPDQPMLRYNHALLLATATGRVDEARRELETLLDRIPDHSDALFLAGELALEQNDIARAREYWEQLSDNEPFYPDLNFRLGSLLDDHYPKDYLDAAAHLRRATKDKDALGDAYFRYGRILGHRLGRKKKAIRQLRKAVEVTPGNAVAHLELARLLSARGEVAAARNEFLTASRLDPELNTERNNAAFPEATPAPAASTDRSAEDHDLLLSLQEKVAALEQELTRRPSAAKTSTAPASAPEKKPGQGKTVLISGATSGIGRASARRLARAGYRLILLGRRSERLEELSNELADKYGTETFNLQVDVRHREEVRMAIANLPHAWKNIDVLLNNAGKAKGFDPVHTGNYAHWDEMIDVNLKGLLTLTREVSPLMVARKTGTIINVCSTAGKEVYPNGNVYCATKHAVDALTYAMRLDLVKYGVRVGQICPAHVEETEFAVVRFDGDKERAKIYDDFQPLRSGDVAEAVHFMVTQPAHVNIMDVVLQGTQQASSTVVDRSGRDRFKPEEE